MAPLLQKPQVMCAAHPKEQLRVFCQDCCHSVCVLCAVDVKLCKKHGTEALDTLIEELKTEREEWARAQEECQRGAEQLCLHIQADADAKIQRISNEAATLQQQVRAVTPNVSSDLLYQTLLSYRFAPQPTSAQPLSAPSCASASSARSLSPALLHLPRLQ